MGLLSRDQILKAEDFRTVDVEVPEWGGTVRLRVMNGTQRERFEEAFQKTPYGNTRARLVAYSACDEAGEPVFSELDIEALGAKSSAALDRLFDVALKLNRISKSDIDTLEGNSAASR
jgi:hypothetical protein